MHLCQQTLCYLYVAPTNTHPDRWEERHQTHTARKTVIFKTTSISKRHLKSGFRCGACPLAARGPDGVTVSTRCGGCAGGSRAAGNGENRDARRHRNGAMGGATGHRPGRSRRADGDSASCLPPESAARDNFALEKPMKFGPSDVRRDYRKKTTAASLPSAAVSRPH